MKFEKISPERVWKGWKVRMGEHKEKSDSQQTTQQDIINMMQKDYAIEIESLKAKLYDKQEELEEAKKKIEKYEITKYTNLEQYKAWLKENEDIYSTPIASESRKIEIDAEYAAMKLPSEQFKQLLGILTILL